MTETEKNEISSPELIPPARVAPASTPNYYTITEHELNELSRGTPVSLFLIFATFFLSLAGSIIGSTLPTLLSEIEHIHWLLYFLFYFGLASFLAGGMLLFIWWYNGKKLTSLTKKIKGRMPANGN